MEWGTSKQMFERLPEVTPAEERRPILFEEAAFYLACFDDLSATRAEGFNRPQRITVAEMLAYCRMFDIEDTERFFRNIAAADSVYMEFVAKQQKAGK